MTLLGNPANGHIVSNGGHRPRSSGPLEKYYYCEYETGEGTFGRVVCVKDKNTGILKNSKSISKHHSRQPLDLLKARNALKMLAAASHAHVCKLHEYMEDETQFHVIQDHPEGGELQDFLERIATRNWLEERTVALYVQQILMACAYMHNEGFYHGELKPSCIVLTSTLPDARVMVTDFGLAQIFDPTNVMIRMKPTCYMPPELIEVSSVKDMISERTDLWSVGIIAYLMLVNTTPFPAGYGLHPKELVQSMSQGIKFFVDDGWSERTWISRDFLRNLVCPANVRHTAAQALGSEWIRTFAAEPYSIPPNLNGAKRACVAKGRPSQKAILTVGLLIAAAKVTPTVVQSHHEEFSRIDVNRDGYILAHEALRFWSQENQKWTAADVQRMLGYVALTDIVDLSTFVLLGVMLEYEQCRKAQDGLAASRALCSVAFHVFGPHESISLMDITAKVKTNVARQIEFITQNTVNFSDILDGFPNDKTIDAATFLTYISQHTGRGTPLATPEEQSGLYSEDDLDDVPWTERLQLGKFNFMLPLAVCGFGSSKRREK